ncbi:MAG TPA: hypothetical protein ENN22_08785 [bacterium]|nr:hypothetical protein [bacterium]
MIGCHKRAIPPENDQIFAPAELKLISEDQSLVAVWQPVHFEEISGYKIFYGKTSRVYSDTILVHGSKSYLEIKNLEQNQGYYCAIASVDRNGFESELSPEAFSYTYFTFENFSQSVGPLDTLMWHYDVGYQSFTNNGHVTPTKVELNGGIMMRSFGQYRKIAPADNFVLSGEFKLGVPNMGGAGLQIRSAKANPNNYFKGYLVYLFWNRNHWYLHVEKNQPDFYAQSTPHPIQLPEILPDEWVKLSVKYFNGVIIAEVIRLWDYSELGRIKVSITGNSRRPGLQDRYCGFFTAQYGRNAILVDNFGISHFLPENQSTSFID